MIVKNFETLDRIAKLWRLRNFVFVNLRIAKLCDCETSGFRNSVIAKNLSDLEKVHNVLEKYEISKNLQWSRKFCFFRKWCNVLENYDYFENPITQTNFEIIQFQNLATSRSNFFLIQERKYRVSNGEHERNLFFVISKISQNGFRNDGSDFEIMTVFRISLKHTQMTFAIQDSCTSWLKSTKTWRKFKTWWFLWNFFVISKRSTKTKVEF